MGAAEVATHFSPRDAQAFRGQRMVRIEVVNERTANLLVGLNTVGIGTAQVDVFASELPAIEAMVEPKENVEAAERRFRQHLLEDTAKKLSTPNREVTAADVEKLMDDPEQGARARETFASIKARTHDSVSRCFRDLHSRDMGPLTSVKKVGDAINPYTKQQDESHSGLVVAVKQALAEGNKNGK